ncbi:MAG: hypothetical protein GX096_10730 [Clostridiales bacterium]|nr:hypothetical protein [Clostridiales bacterium]
MSSHNHETEHDHTCNHEHNEHEHCHHDHGEHEHCHHTHGEHEHCGCSGEHHGEPVEISDQEHSFLHSFVHHPYLPLARFLMASTKSSHIESIALAPVYLTDNTLNVPEVRQVGDMLAGLEDKGIISLDYDMPLGNYDYKPYQDSAAFHALEDVVREGSQQEGFLFDRAIIETGSMALTEFGQQVMSQLCCHECHE